jgi:cyclic-di-GMP phosphodiesterase TipF (flagellum assembly factor)
MDRLRERLVVLCIAAMAVALGVILALTFGRPRLEAAGVSLLVLLAILLIRSWNANARTRHGLARNLDDLSLGTGELARQVTDIGRRVQNLELRVLLNPPGDHAAPAVSTPAPDVTVEVEALSTLLHELAETVADHEIAIADARGRIDTLAERPMASIETPVRPAAPRPVPAAAPDIAAAPAPRPPARLAAMPGALVADVQQAIAAGRVDLLLQPVVSLPQRRLRFYDLVIQLPLSSGGALAGNALDALPPDARAPLDDLVLLRSLQVARRLLEREREAAILCPIHPALLADPRRAAPIRDLAASVSGFAAGFVPRLPADAFIALDNRDRASVAALTTLGLRVCLDGDARLAADPKGLADRGVRLVRIGADALLAEAMPGADIHPADIPALFARQGIDLIATGIAAERTVADLLDTDARFAQGDLFGAPRPVRAEAAPVQTRTPAPAQPAPRDIERTVASQTRDPVREPAREIGRRSLARLARPPGGPRG